MKLRLWLISLVLISLFILAGARDWSNVGENPLPSVSSGSASIEDEILHSCETSQMEYIGPLVPAQETPFAGITQNDFEPQGSIPPSRWSTRAGFSISYSTDPVYWAKMLGSGWYLDWSVRNESTTNGPEHWQMIRVHEDCVSPSPDTIQKIAARYPGQIWIIGNEPDVIWQDNVTPARYSMEYHALYQLIKSSDPSAKIAVGGISQATPLRLQYLDQVLLTYQNLYHETLPADWWTVHGYVLREEKGSWGVEIPPGMNMIHGKLYEVTDHGRLDLFEGQILDFRQWMKDNGYQHIPLAVTEFGILMPISYGFPTQFISDYLNQTFTWLYNTQDSMTGFPEDAYHLVQKWAWFSISDPNYSSSNLGDIITGQLTLVGEQFRTWVSLKGQ